MTDYLIPDGFISLAEALELVGEHIYGEEWRGPRYKTVPASVLLQYANRTLLALPEDAVEERAVAEEELFQLWDKIFLKKEHIDRANNHLWRLLHSGSITSKLVGTGSGHQPFIPIELWASSGARRIVETGEASFDPHRYPGSQPPGRGMPPGVIWGCVYVHREELTAALEGRALPVARHTAEADDADEVAQELALDQTENEQPKAVRQRQRNAEKDRITKNKIEMVIAAARREWPESKDRPTPHTMAKALRDSGKDYEFALSTLKKILAGTYPAIQKLGVKPL